MKYISLRLDGLTEDMLEELINKKKHLSQNGIICEAIRVFAKNEGCREIKDVQR